jgi:hypothetical protein
MRVVPLCRPPPQELLGKIGTTRLSHDSLRERISQVNERILSLEQAKADLVAVQTCLDGQAAALAAQHTEQEVGAPLPQQIGMHGRHPALAGGSHPRA